jgi:hypothetical protein
LPTFRGLRTLILRTIPGTSPSQSYRTRRCSALRPSLLTVPSCSMLLPATSPRASPNRPFGKYFIFAPKLAPPVAVPYPGSEWRKCNGEILAYSRLTDYVERCQPRSSRERSPLVGGSKSLKSLSSAMLVKDSFGPPSPIPFGLLSPLNRFNCSIQSVNTPGFIRMQYLNLCRHSRIRVSWYAPALVPLGRSA